MSGSEHAIAGVATANDTDARARITENGNAIEVVCGTDIKSLRLPVQVVQPTEDPIVLPRTAIRTLRLRAREANNTTSQQENITPWMSESLPSSTELSCASCKVVLVPRGNITQWKDLPSDGWAEMMEFWHCHKPDEHDTYGHQTSQKGYSASSQLNIESGVGLLDATTMLLSPNDVQGLTEYINGDITIQCCSCTADLGCNDIDTHAVRLSKSSILISDRSKTSGPPFNKEKWSACSLLTAMENQGVHRLNVVCRTADAAYLVWIFAPFLLVSSTMSELPQPLSVVKVLWKPATRQEALRNDEKLSGGGSSTGILELTALDFQELVSCLTTAVGLLPANGGTFNGWNVALLPRFTQVDVRSSIA
ncbi:hypothetical protein AMS68_003626 [Peltaster fructicola]|uniref:Ubiquitin-conjugating enzyme E2C-binding protein n=1 Tax=Peltaster fructicola TaxID=286661 RepID=A0A6H0XU15_9PEZI|nr:hypothetical protein AMS68_003626 [Peltaster fructicola]